MYDDQCAKARKGREDYARSHPIRARILELYGKGLNRPLTATDMQPTLDGLPRPTLAAVAYHVQVLRDTGLIPEN